MADNIPNINDSSPAAPAGEVNVKWQAIAPDADPTVPRDISAYMPKMTATVGGAVPTPPNDATEFLNGTGVFSTPSAGTLAGDSDVVITSPANNDVLTYETSSTKWKNKPASGGGGSVPSGSIVVPMPSPGLQAGSSVGWSNFTLLMKLFGESIVNQCSSWKIALRIASGTLDVNKAVVLRTLAGSLTVIDSTSFTFNGVAGPWSLAAADVTSDAISLAVDNDHDYYVMLYLNSSSNNAAVGLTFNNASGNSGLGANAFAWTIGGGYFSGDETAVATIGSITSPGNIYGWLSVRVA